MSAPSSFLERFFPKSSIDRKEDNININMDRLPVSTWEQPLDKLYQTLKEKIGLKEMSEASWEVSLIDGSKPEEFDTIIPKLAAFALRQTVSQDRAETDLIQQAAVQLLKASRKTIFDYVKANGYDTVKEWYSLNDVYSETSPRFLFDGADSQPWRPEISDKGHSGEYHCIKPFDNGIARVYGRNGSKSLELYLLNDPQYGDHIEIKKYEFLSPKQKQTFDQICRGKANYLDNSREEVPNLLIADMARKAGLEGELLEAEVALIKESVPYVASIKIFTGYLESVKELERAEATRLHEEREAEVARAAEECEKKRLKEEAAERAKNESRLNRLGAALNTMGKAVRLSDLPPQTDSDLAAANSREGKQLA